MRHPGFGRRLAGLVAMVAFSVAGTRLTHAQASPLPSGRVGVGTYNTIAQFKDLQVTVGGQVVLQKSLGDKSDLQESGGGQWEIRDGVLQQSRMQASGMRVFAGDKDWTDYTVSVKARKISGNEGFYLIFRMRDEQNLASLTLGGAANTKTQFSMRVNNNFSELGESVPLKVDEGRWYDVKVEVKGDEVTGYVDGQKVAQTQLLTSAVSGTGAPARRGPAPAAAPAPVAVTPPVAPASPANVGGTKAVTPAVVAKPQVEGMSTRDKMMYAGAGVIVLGFVAIYAMQFRKRPAGKSK